MNDKHFKVHSRGQPLICSLIPSEHASRFRLFHATCELHSCIGTSGDSQLEVWFVPIIIFIYMFNMCTYIYVFLTIDVYVCMLYMIYIMFSYMYNQTWHGPLINEISLYNMYFKKNNAMHV